MENNKRFLWVLLAFVAFSLLFINKALHIDDPFTVTIAKAIGGHCINVPKTYQGNRIFMDQVYDNPILLGYYYAPIVSLFGEKEAWLHLFFLPFPLIAIIAMYILSRRFSNSSLLVTICLFVTPAFIVMSQTIMLDTPLLAFFLSALAAFILGVDKDNKKLLFLSGILAAVASLIKYSGLLVILTMFIYAFTTPKKRYSLFLLIPLFIFSLWCVHNFIFYKQIYFLVAVLTKAKEFSLNPIPYRVFACLSFISGTSIISVFLIPYLLDKKINRSLLALSSTVGLSPFLLKDYFMVHDKMAKDVIINGYGTVEKVILAFLFISSFFIILVILKNCALYFLKNQRNKDSLFLSLWFILILAFCIFIQSVTARFILLLFPPMLLLIFRELRSNKDLSSVGHSNKFIFTSILVTTIISTVLAIGDYRLAGVYRDFTASLKKRLPAGKEVYFCPDSFDTNLCYGYAYYLQKYYLQPQAVKADRNLDKSNNLIYVFPGGAFLSPSFYESCAGYPPESDYRKNLIESISYKGNIFLHNRKFRAGFYSHDWGLLPFYISFRQLPLETFYIYSLIISRGMNDL